MKLDGAYPGALLLLWHGAVVWQLLKHKPSGAWQRSKPAVFMALVLWNQAPL